MAECALVWVRSELAGDWLVGRVGGTGRISNIGSVLGSVMLGTQTSNLGGLEVPFWYPGTQFGWSKGYLGHPMGRFRVQAWIWDGF